MINGSVGSVGGGIMRTNLYLFKQFVTQTLSGDFELKICESRKISRELFLSLKPETLKKELHLQLDILQDKINLEINYLRKQLEDTDA